VISSLDDVTRSLFIMSAPEDDDDDDDDSDDFSLKTLIPNTFKHLN